MKGMKERLAKKIKLITIVSTLKQNLAHHKNNVDRTIHHLKEEIVVESGQNRENCPPGGEDSVVFYTTGLRGVRKTFEACRRVRFLLENHKVVFKERDVSMDSEFRDEMWRLLGGKVTSPRLFIRGRYIGGADEVVALNENGKLKKLLEGISLVGSPCECCENERFLICSSCNGSSRLIAEQHDDDETSNDNKMWTRCRECNENGLVKCPLCS
ncbi:Glutaredoxin family protein [Raphanus sativus]|nr:Glutaredoxin family protein [Raphanus sativus]